MLALLYLHERRGKKEATDTVSTNAEVDVQTFFFIKHEKLVFRAIMKTDP